MFLTHCMMGWTVLAVLSISVPVWSSMKVTQPYSVVSTNGTAEIHCTIHHRTSTPDIHANRSFLDVEDMQVTLLRGLHGSQKICSSTVTISEQQEIQPEKDGDNKCEVQIKYGAVVVSLSELKATHTDIYLCEIHILYPPPIRRLRGNGTLLHVLESSHCPFQGPQRQQIEEEDKDEGNDEIKTAVSVPVVVLVIIIICVLVIIITFQTLQCERGRREPSRASPYILSHKVDAVPLSCGAMA